MIASPQDFWNPIHRAFRQVSLQPANSQLATNKLNAEVHKGRRLLTAITSVTVQQLHFVSEKGRRLKQRMRSCLAYLVSRDTPTLSSHPSSASIRNSSQRDSIWSPSAYQALFDMASSSSEAPKDKWREDEHALPDQVSAVVD